MHIEFLLVYGVRLKSVSPYGEPIVSTQLL